MIFSDCLGVQNLPTDYRTLQHTPKSVEIISAAGGQYWYNGIGNNIKQIFSSIDKNISIQMNFNVDGLPIFKSSQRCFWPILGNIHSKVIEIVCSYTNILSMEFHNSIFFIDFIRHAQYSPNRYFNMVRDTKTKQS